MERGTRAAAGAAARAARRPSLLGLAAAALAGASVWGLPRPAHGLPEAAQDTAPTSTCAGGQAAAEGPEGTCRPSLTEQPREELATAQDLEWHVVSHYPRIYVKDNFLSADECEFLKGLAGDRLEPAKVVEQASNKYDTQTQVRNNRQIWLTTAEEREVPLLRHILKRMHRAARVPDDDAEALQIGHYAVGEKYELHLDSDPANDVPRPATMIIYLQETEAGGETLFPLTPEVRKACAGWHTLDNGTRVYGIKKCCTEPQLGALKIPPRAGRAVLFWNHDLAGNKDMGAEHAACPVIQGEKWIVQRWFRFSPYQRIVHPPDPRFDGMPPASAASGASAESLRGTLDVRVLSQKDPRVYLVEDLLSPEECSHLISVAKALEPFEENGMERRWLQPEVEAKDPVIAAVAKRLHRAALVPEGQGESLQLGYSKPGAAVQFHLDSAPQGGLVRPLTILVYLDGDGQSGTAGATVFPLSRCREMKECCELAALHRQDGGGPLAVPPRAGRALLFASHRLDGSLDPQAAHGACPAGHGGKWVAQRWFQPGLLNRIGYGNDPRFDGFEGLQA